MEITGKLILQQIDRILQLALCTSILGRFSRTNITFIIISNIIIIIIMVIVSSIVVIVIIIIVNIIIIIVIITIMIFV